MRVGHLWYHAAARRQGRWRTAFERIRPCDPGATVAKLSNVPQPELAWWERWAAILTTPFKYLGVSGWSDTGCSGRGRGRLVRDAQHSTDGFWTIDVSLEHFRVGEVDVSYGRFLRLEIEPGTKAHDICAERRLRAEENVLFGGPIVVDTDGPFLEVHPGKDFEMIFSSRRSEATPHFVRPREEWRDSR